MKNYLLHFLIITISVLLAFQGSARWIRGDDTVAMKLEIGTGAIMGGAALVGVTREYVEQRRKGKIKQWRLSLVGAIFFTATMIISIFFQASTMLFFAWIAVGSMTFLSLLAADYFTLSPKEGK